MLHMLQEQENKRKQRRQARLKELRACVNGAHVRMQPGHMHAPNRPQETVSITGSI